MESPTVRRLRISLGTLVAIEATARSPSAAQDAIHAAFEAVADIDRRMHPQKADSDLARINNAPLQTPVAVHADTCELLRLAQRLHLLTRRMFDPCLPCRPGTLRDIEIHCTEGATCQVICHAPVALDFGGFAKGYAVDQAINVLIANGCSAGLVNAGGDLRVFGQRTEPILLRGPRDQFSTVELSDAALAVSDTDSTQRPAEHQGYYSRAETDLIPVTRYAAVVAKRAVIADALVKCVLLCAKPVADHALKEFGASNITAAHAATAADRAQ